MKLAIEIAVECDKWVTAIPALDELAARVSDACLAEAHPRLAEGAELSLLFCDDATIRALNASWRQQDKATNVLSFPAAPPGRLAAARLLGDVALAFETVEREAREQGKPLRDHVAHLIAHGILHLLGFDHENDADAERMERSERAALARLGLADPYRAHDLEAR